MSALFLLIFWSKNEKMLACTYFEWGAYGYYFILSDFLFSINCTVVRFPQNLEGIVDSLLVFRSSFAGDLIFPSFSLWFYYFRTICLSMDFRFLLALQDFHALSNLKTHIPSAPNISLLLVLCQFVLAISAVFLDLLLVKC